MSRWPGLSGCARPGNLGLREGVHDRCSQVLLGLAAITTAMDVVPLSVHGGDDTLPARAYVGTDYYTNAQAVCHLTVPLGNGTGQATGFLVGPDLVMANRYRRRFVRLAGDPGRHHRVVGLHAGGNGGGPFMHDLVPIIRRFLPARPTGAIWIDNDDGMVCIGCMDADLAGAGTVVVELSSSAGDTETLVLSAGEPGRFAADIALARDDATADDGILQAGYFHTIYASYADADDGSGAAAAATTVAMVDERNRWFQQDFVQLSHVRLLFTPAPDDPNGYTTSLQVLDELPHPPDGSELELGNAGDGVGILLPQALQLYGQDVQSVWMFRNGQLSLDAKSAGFSGRSVFWQAPRIVVCGSRGPGLRWPVPAEPGLKRRGRLVEPALRAAAGGVVPIRPRPAASSAGSGSW
ncbi:MAG: hypothetical protein ACOCXA_00215 [Planctomycetota bacterium]